MNNKNKYRIKGTGEFLDGLIVTINEEDQDSGIMEVQTIEQQSQLFETFAVPVHGLFLEYSKLEKYVEPNEDFLTDNPYGVFKSETRYEFEDLEVLCALYSRALTVNIRNNGKSLYTHNFFDNEKIKEVSNYLQNICFQDDLDANDIIFDLQELE